MKRKVSGFLLALLCLCAVFFQACAPATEDAVGQGTLLLDGTAKDDFPVIVTKETVYIPFLRTAQALGMQIEKQETSVTVQNGGETFLLRYSPEVSFVREGDTNNLMIATPGTTSYYCQYKSGDVFLDCETLSEVFHQMGLDLEVSVAPATSTVTITTK